MAKKQETISMIESLAEFKELKNIDKETMINVLEDSFWQKSSDRTTTST